MSPKKKKEKRSAEEEGKIKPQCRGLSPAFHKGGNLYHRRTIHENRNAGPQVRKKGTWGKEKKGIPGGSSDLPEVV